VLAEKATMLLAVNHLATLPLPGGNLTLYGAAAAAVLLLLLVLVALGRKKKVSPEAGLAEDLATYPPAPRGPRHYELRVMNLPVRLRLVVVAPVGKKPLGKVDSVLEQVFRGLGEVSIDDKPRIRVWPAQLSTTGFAPTFFRLTRKPEPDPRPSRWVLLAGPARAGSTPVLLGLACQADEPCKLGLVTLDERQWGEVLSVLNA
jgi:hypothetical protein